MQSTAYSVCPLSISGFAGKNWCITNERHTKRGMLYGHFRGDEWNYVSRCVYIHNCAKRKSDETTSSASDNTYQPVVSVLDVPSISNTKKSRGITVYLMTYHLIDEDYQTLQR
jgi:hypothetical protein